MLARYDGHGLAAADRSLAKFCVTLHVDDCEIEACFDEVLRHLPGKRVVAAGALGSDGSADGTGTTSGLDREKVVAKFFLGPKAQRDLAREKAGYELLVAHGLATPALVCEAAIAGGYAWITQRRQAVPFGDCMANDNSEWSVRLGRALASLHERGLVHTDIHLDNFLWESDRLWMIDAGAIEQHAGSLPRAKAVEQLAVLLAQLPIAAVVLAHTVVAAYGETRGWPLSELESEARPALASARAGRVKSYLRKTLRECTAFAEIDHGDLAGMCDREVMHEGAIAKLIDDPDATMRAGRTVKTGNTTTVVQVGRFAVKRYNVKSRMHLLRVNARASRARRSWVAGHRLHFQGIETAKPIAFFERHHAGLRRESYLVTEWVSGPTLDAVAESRAQAVPVQACVDLLGAMRRAEVAQRDTKASNFIVTPTGLCLIDLDSLSGATHRKTRNSHERFLRNFDGQTRVAIGQALDAEMDRLA